MSVNIAGTARQQRRNLLAQSSLSPSSKKGEIRKARQREAIAIEKDARDHLNRVLLEIASQPSNDISVIQRRHANEVEDIIRAAANNAFISGVNYVASLKEVNHKTYLTTPDIQKIKSLTAEFEQIFWRRVTAVLHQKDVISSILSARFSTKSKLSLTNIVSGFIVRLVTKAIAMGTVAKSNAFTNRAKASRKAPLLSAAMDEQVDIMEWATEEDDRVCPICEALDGEQWNANDPDMPTPGDDTHDNCRCRLDIVGNADEVGTTGGTDASDDSAIGDSGSSGGNNLLGLGITAGLGSTALGLIPAPGAEGQDCPEGQTWAPKKAKCQECQPDEHTDLKTGECVPDNCPKDQHWDDDLQRCVDDT